MALPRVNFADMENGLGITRTLRLRDRVTGERLCKFILRRQRISQFNPAFGEARAQFHRGAQLHLGFGFFDIEFTAPYPDSLRDVITFRQDNRDVHRIIRHFLTKTSQKDILVY